MKESPLLKSVKNIKISSKIPQYDPQIYSRKITKSQLRLEY